MDINAAPVLRSMVNAANGVMGLDASGNAVGIFIPRHNTQANLNGIVLSENELAVTTDTQELRMGDGSTAGGVVMGIGSGFVVPVAAIGTPAQNATALVNAYTKAKSLTPGGSALSLTNRATVMLMPGIYDLTAANTTLTIDTAYVDIIGAAGSTGTIIILGTTNYVKQTADNVILRGLTFYISSVGFLYQSTSTGNVVHDDIFYACGSFVETTPTNTTCMTMSVMTGFSGFYRRCRTNGRTMYGGLQMTGTINPTFVDCEICCQSGSTGAMGFGDKGTNVAPTGHVFTGTMRRCRGNFGHLNMDFEGLMEGCYFNVNSGKFCVDAGAQLYGNRIIANGSNYCLDVNGTTPTIKAAGNLFGGGNSTGSSGINGSITNSITASGANIWDANIA